MSWLHLLPIFQVLQKHYRCSGSVDLSSSKRLWPNRSISLTKHKLVNFESVYTSCLSQLDILLNCANMRLISLMLNKNGTRALLLPCLSMIRFWKHFQSGVVTRIGELPIKLPGQLTNQRCWKSC